MLWKLSTRKRILIAIVAIPSIHFLFWFVPRWWATRPRFYEGAWREAVSILEEEIGAAAVEKGIFEISKRRASAPYVGDAFVMPRGRRQVGYAYVRVGREDCWLVLTDGSRKSSSGAEGVTAARLDRAQARALWAAFRYITLIDGKIATDARIGGDLWYGEIDLADRTWRRGRRPSFREDDRLPWISSARDCLAHSCAGRLVERLKKRSDIDICDEKEVVLPAITAVLESALPPVSRWDKWRIDCLTIAYEKLAGRSAVGLLERIDKLKHEPADYWLWRMEPVRDLLKLERRPKMVYRHNRDLEGTIWRLRDFAGLPDERKRAAALEAGLNHPAREVSAAAWEALAEIDGESFA